MQRFILEADEGELGTIKIPEGFKGKVTRIAGDNPAGLAAKKKNIEKKEVIMANGICKDCLQKDRELDKKDREMEKLREKMEAIHGESSGKDTKFRDMEVGLRDSLGKAQQQIAEKDEKIKEVESTFDLLKQKALRVDALTGEIENLKNTVELPPLRNLITHCEDGSCGAHKQEWQEVKREIISQALEQLPDDFLRRKAFEKNIIPKSIKVEVP